MEFPGINASGLFGASVSKQSQGLSQVFRSSASGESAEAVPPTKKRGRGFGNGNGFALGALRQEIRAALTERFRVAFSGAGYSQPAPTAGDVAGDALAAAGQVANASPLEASDALKQLRDDVEAAGDAVRGIISDDDLDDVEDAIARISEGLDQADDDAARNVVSSASVLSAESILKQRSTIRIRTQEGDVVTLDLRRRESFSAEDVAVQGEGLSFTSTEVSASSRSRLSFSVRGDINEQELAAIQGVFEQAEAIADDFFGGDLAAAFDTASRLNYDGEQLARVSLKFREREVTRVDFAQVGSTGLPSQAAPIPSAEPVRSPVGIPSPESVLPSAPANDVFPGGVDAQPVAESSPVEASNIGAELVQASAAATEADEPEAPVPAVEDAADSFVAQLGEFLRSTLEGFGDGGDQRFFYSESFKLSILKSVISVSAPEGREAAGDVAGKVIDAVASDERDD